MNHPLVISFAVADGMMPLTNTWIRVSCLPLTVLLKTDSAVLNILIKKKFLKVHSSLIDFGEVRDYST